MNVGDFFTDADGKWQVTCVRDGVVTGSILVEPSVAFDAARAAEAAKPRPPSMLEVLVAELKAASTLADTKAALLKFYGAA